jgi:hypothetical protein
MHEKSGFTTSIGVGTPPQWLTRVVLDTGSGIFWVNSLKCKDESCKANYQFDSSKSKSYEESAYDVEVHYGTGSVKGVVSKDDITLAGYKIKDQTFGEIEKETASVFVNYGGILGLCFPEMAEKGVDLVFDNMMD